jgi:NAD-dependent dihydropyrimidine dehydrogenase PreA subunit
MRYLLSGRSLALATELCNGCGRCEEVCPHAVFAIVDRKAVIAARDGCMECGACRMNCPPGAIQVSSGVGCAQAVMNARRGKGTTCDGACSCG